MANNGKPQTQVKAIVGEGLVFELEAQLIPVVIGEEEFELREASSSAACRWQNDFLSKAKLGPDGKIQSTKDIADSEPFLVHLCMFYAGTQNRVPLEVVRSWPSRIVKQLFKKAKDISGLDETVEGSVKNEPSDTKDG